VEAIPVPRIVGALLFVPTPHVDERGFFTRTFDSAVARTAGIDPAGFAQDSLSRSARGVIRGLHSRSGAGEAKLVRCSYGAIFDVVVDLRPDSPTYRNWESFELRDTEQVSLYIPAGCAHGFQALTEPADVSYRIDRAHDPAEDISIACDDPELAIPWPLPVTITSERDKAALPLHEAERLLLARRSALYVSIGASLAGCGPHAEALVIVIGSDEHGGVEAYPRDPHHFARRANRTRV
jgi:dTDP-4-dehydrorhamnose 3,5-epimerase